MGMAKGSTIAGPAIVGLALLVSGCQNFPLYDESLNWFSWSEYDPEMKAIEAEVPPPGELEAKPTADDRAAFVRDGSGGYVQSAPPPGTIVSVGSVPVVSASATAAGNVSSAQSSGTGATSPGDPLVGIRNSYAPSVTWRSARGAP
jgi:hypothetical protein